MRQFAVKKTITYRWWREARSQEVRKAHVEELKEEAESHIRIMSSQGFTSGQLLHRTRLRGISYIGHWEVKDE